MEEERRRGYDRRSHPPGRAVYSKGPIIRFLEVTSFLAAVLAGLSIALAGHIFSGQIDTKASKNQVSLIQQERRRAATDTCTILRKMIFLATPVQKKLIAVRFLKKVGIYDCNDYGRDVIKVHPKPGGQ